MTALHSSVLSSSNPDSCIGFGGNQDDLLRSIAQVGTIAQPDIDRMSTELAPFLPCTEVNYPAFQNGSWKLLALLNNSGDPTDTTVREGKDVTSTPVLEAMPTVRRVIDEHFSAESIVLARIARLAPGGKLWEHVDYTELDEAVPRRRFHIPLQTEREAVLVTHGNRIHMALGGLFVLNPRGAHGVTHDGTQDRVHIIVDAQVDGENSFDDPYLNPVNVEPLALLTSEQIDATVEAMATMISEGRADEAVAYGLNLFYTSRLPLGTSTHLMIAQAFAQTGDQVETQRWLDNNNLYMGGMFKHD